LSRGGILSSTTTVLATVLATKCRERLVTGDSYRSQSANTIHFGLGSAAQVERAEIVWANGDQLLLKQPKVNQYHLISPPRK